MACGPKMISFSALLGWLNLVAITDTEWKYWWWSPSAFVAKMVARLHVNFVARDSCIEENQFLTNSGQWEWLHTQMECAASLLWVQRCSDMAGIRFQWANIPFSVDLTQIISLLSTGNNLGKMSFWVHVCLCQKFADIDDFRTRLCRKLFGPFVDFMVYIEETRDTYVVASTRLFVRLFLDFSQ